jgi:hypothetical protein
MRDLMVDARRTSERMMFLLLEVEVVLAVV